MRPTSSVPASSSIHMYDTYSRRVKAGPVDNSRGVCYGRRMRVTRSATTRTCAICERSLLMGEHAIRFSPDGGEYVDVCPLCAEIALEHGWLREGSPSMPTVPLDAAAPQEPLGRPARRPARRGGARRGRADPAPPLRARARASSRPPTSSTRARTGARSPASPRASARRRRRSSRSRASAARWSSPSPGRSPGTSTASRPTRRSRCGSPSAATTSRSSTRASRSWNAQLRETDRTRGLMRPEHRRAAPRCRRDRAAEPPQTCRRSNARIATLLVLGGRSGADRRSRAGRALHRRAEHRPRPARRRSSPRSASRSAGSST